MGDSHYWWSLEEIERNYRDEFLAENITSKYIFNSVNSVDEKVFSKTDIETLNIVYLKYGSLSPFQLSDLI